MTSIFLKNVVLIYTEIKQKTAIQSRWGSLYITLSVWVQPPQPQVQVRPRKQLHWHCPEKPVDLFLNLNVALRRFRNAGPSQVWEYLMRFEDSKCKAQVQLISITEECGRKGIGLGKFWRIKKEQTVLKYYLLKGNILNLKCCRTTTNEEDRQHFASICFQRFLTNVLCALVDLMKWFKGLSRAWRLQKVDLGYDSVLEKLNVLLRINYSLIQVVLLKCHSSFPATYFPSH